MSYVIGGAVILVDVSVACDYGSDPFCATESSYDEFYRDYGVCCDGRSDFCIIGLGVWTI